jgi:hypothetical protein
VQSSCWSIYKMHISRSVYSNKLNLSSMSYVITCFVWWPLISSTELAPFGIRVNAVSPGALKSHFNMRFGDIFTKQEQLETVSILSYLQETYIRFSFLFKSWNLPL